MNLFKNVYNELISEARAGSVSNISSDQESYRTGKIKDPEILKKALQSLNVEAIKKLKTDPDNLTLARELFNTIRGIPNSSIASKYGLTELEVKEIKNSSYQSILDSTKTEYHDYSSMADNDILRFKNNAKKIIMNLPVNVETKIKINSKIPEWHLLYDEIFQEIYGRDSDEYRDKVQSYTKRDISSAKNAESPIKIEKSYVYYFDGDPADSDTKPFRTTIIIPPNDYSTLEEMEQNVPIEKSFWNDPRTSKAYNQKLPAPWPFNAYTPKGLRGKTINEIRDLVKSDDAELEHKKVYPPSKFPNFYTLK
jgi:hypothetical protein